MIPALVYPLPFDNWTPFKPWVERFTESFRRFEPGCDYVLYAICNFGEPTDAIKEMFYGIRTRFIGYAEFGCDIGSAQTLAINQKENRPIVGFTTRCFLHREGWLKRLMDVRTQLGLGAYFCSASKDTGLHGCTRAYMLDSDLWKQYPHKITHRKQGPFFEIGRDNPNGNLFNWAKAMLAKTVVVHWDQTFDLSKEEDVRRYFECPDRFRGAVTQDGMLVRDFHSETYDQSPPEEKLRLTKIGLGETV